MAWYDEFVERWRPPRGWRDTFEPAARRVEQSPADTESWCDIIMLLGDTRATEFALLACLRARALGADQARLSPHLHLCLLDLGLASASGPVPLRDPASAMTTDDAALAAWAREHLAPFDGDLGRALTFILELTRSKLA
ncbi:MAG TPA: hypothetical protein VFS43_24880 [Polyangiaceae bacterium]|nr:hypothetical protein [Polyangiaceae bacterium]